MIHINLTEESQSVWREYVSDQTICQMKNYRQHRNINTYDHSVNVAFIGCKIGNIFKLNASSINNIIIGAMCHDLYLYDWHTGRKRINGLHGIVHPQIALSIANNHFDLNERQQNIIRSHMFPMTLLHPPKYKEAWIVTLADKFCAVSEYIGHSFFSKYQKGRIVCCTR